jgi:hypothetical protein
MCKIIWPRRGRIVKLALDWVYTLTFVKAGLRVAESFCKRGGFGSVSSNNKGTFLPTYTLGKAMYTSNYALALIYQVG